MKKRNIMYIEMLVILFLFIISKNLPSSKIKYYDEMIEARNHRIVLAEEIYKEKEKRNIFIDKEIDVNETGLLGEEFTGITTTMGYLDSKLLSINPDFAPYIVKKLKEENLKEGDLVFVNMSSSFPGLNLSVISALDTLKLKGVIINSIGASMYGANNEEFTFLEMERHLKEKNLIKNEIIAYSLGGERDIGKNFDEEVKLKLEKRLEKVKIKRFTSEDRRENLNERTDFYNSFGEPKYFINIGGNLLFESLEKYYSERNIPTLSLLNIKQLAVPEEITINMAENPIEIKLYQEESNKIINILIILVFLLGTMAMYKNKKN